MGPAILYRAAAFPRDAETQASWPTPSALAAHIESLGSSRVACVGDVMLDRFVYGRVERTSPEAPVPILRTDHDVYMLGGAGNVVRNLVSLGAHATLLSVIGGRRGGAQAHRHRRARGTGRAPSAGGTGAPLDREDRASSPAPSSCSAPIRRRPRRSRPARPKA